MSKYEFFYDESEHSRVINPSTINSNNYYDNFITMIVGYNTEKSNLIQKYNDFEKKYENRKDKKGEIKSIMFKQKQFKYGFASISYQNIQFINDFLSLFDENTHIYFSVYSKIEYIILQMIRNYSNDPTINVEAMAYSIIKSLVVYHPKKIINCLEKSPQNFLKELRTFFQERIEYNQKNTELKVRENNSFRQILIILDSISDDFEIDWDYHMSFDGFKKYLKEKNIVDYHLTIDKEGNEDEMSQTLKAALEMGLNNSCEIKSTKCTGVRIADMLAGIISKVLKNLHDAFKYQSFDDGINKKILDKKWFNLNENQLELYKKLYRLICEWQPAWYKSYVGIYADDLNVFISLLIYMNQFNSIEEINEHLDEHPESFNYFSCTELNNYFERLGNGSNDDYFINQRGAKVYFDPTKQPCLPLAEGSQTYNVLSVGISRGPIPMITIQKNNNVECFQLPLELLNWALTVIKTSQDGFNFFPCNVTFSKSKNRYYADIL